LVPKPFLYLLPTGKRALELGLPGLGKAQPPLSPVFPVPFNHPAVVAHNLQRSGKSSAIHRQDLSQFSLGNFSDNRQRLQNGELRGP
jgi:hypothetical protein